MDDTSDRPTPEALDPEATPSLPEPPPARDEPSNRRRPMALGVTVGVIAAVAILGAIGYFLTPSESEVPFEEGFGWTTRDSPLIVTRSRTSPWWTASTTS